MRKVFFLTTVLAALALAGNVYGVVVISDSEYATGDWIIAVDDVSSYAPDSFAASTVQYDYSGDNVGYSSITWTDYDQLSGNVKFPLGYVYTGASYDPSTQGEILSLDFSLDTERGPLGYSAFIYFGCEQNGNFYYLGGSTNRLRDNAADGVWTTVTRTGVTSADLRKEPIDDAWTGLGIAEYPDFSSSGSVIRFGYLLYNSDGGVNGTFTNYYDDYSVTIDNVPEPATMCLLGLGSLLVFRKKR